MQRMNSCSSLCASPELSMSECSSVLNNSALEKSINGTHKHLETMDCSISSVEIQRECDLSLTNLFSSPILMVEDLDPQSEDNTGCKPLKSPDPMRKRSFDFVDKSPICERKIKGRYRGQTTGHSGLTMDIEAVNLEDVLSTSPKMCSNGLLCANQTNIHVNTMRDDFLSDCKEDSGLYQSSSSCPDLSSLTEEQLNEER